MIPLPPPPLLYLVGYRGTGKTTTARLLADALGWEAVDADALLESRLGRSIREVFDADGEPAFRDHESRLLAELAQRTRCVVATGGGVVLSDENRRRMMQTGRIVWLTADVDTLWRRISDDPATAHRRPALTPAGRGGRDEVEEVLRAREPLYRACADTIIDTAGRTPQDVATAVLAALHPTAR